MSSESGEKKAVTRKPPENHLLACPRCQSTNTKFCYYNNYNLSQPRYFCKSCRRYWTHGGTLRNVPVGGGTRKSSAVKRSRHPLPSPLTHHQHTPESDCLNLDQTVVYESLTPLVTDQNVEDAVVVGFSGVFGSGSGICGPGFELCPWDWSVGERVGGESGGYSDGNCYGGWSDLSISTPPNGVK